MLTGIIGDGMKMKEDDTKNSTDSGSPKDHNRSASNDDNRSKSDRADGIYNYIHYDPELHWCRICDVFPRSAKDYLTHLHSPEHKQATQQHQLVDTPWHKLPADEELPSHKGAPVKRLPIKGNNTYILSVSFRLHFFLGSTLIFRMKKSNNNFHLEKIKQHRALKI